MVRSVCVVAYRLMRAAFMVSCFVALACNRPDGRARGKAAPSGPEHPVKVHASPRLTQVEVLEPQGLGGPVPGSTRVSCETCHSMAGADRKLPKKMSELKTFHQGLSFQHGELSCGSCHVEAPQALLHLADGRVLHTRDAMELCGQCHGPQRRDYRRGSHGGMTGHWALSAGGRTRNHCVDCHDPHAPAIRQVMPALPPRDRFYTRLSSGQEKAH